MPRIRDEFSKWELPGANHYSLACVFTSSDYKHKDEQEKKNILKRIKEKILIKTYNIDTILFQITEVFSQALGSF